MKAALRKKYGILTYEELDKPTPKNNQLLIKIKAAAVNRTDCANFYGKPFIMKLMLGIPKPRNPRIGTEFSGIVEALGPEVSQFKIGDRVFGFNDMGLGTQAEYILISEKENVSTMPDGLTFEEAAGSLEGAHYALNFINKVSIKKDDHILVNGASGGIGSALVQLLKPYGTHLTAVCNTKNITLIKSLGTENVVDYEKDDFTRLDTQFDFVLDSVGKSTFGKCKKILKPGGTYISSELGPWSQNVFYSLITPLFRKKKVAFPFPVNVMATIELVKKSVDLGLFKPIIDQVYDFDQMGAAYDYVSKGLKTGNVVVNIS